MAIFPYIVIFAEIAVVVWFAALLLLMGGGEPAAEPVAKKRPRTSARGPGETRPAGARRKATAPQQIQERGELPPVRAVRELTG